MLASPGLASLTLAPCSPRGLLATITRFQIDNKRGIPKATLYPWKCTFQLRQDLGVDFLPSFSKHVVENVKPAVVLLSGLHGFSFQIAEAQTEVSASEPTPIHISNHK